MAISLPLGEDGFYDKYSKVPVLSYSQAFYDSDSYNESSAKDHAFAKAYKHSSVIFSNQSFIISLLSAILAIQIIFWCIAVYAYIPIIKSCLKNKTKDIKEL